MALYYDYLWSRDSGNYLKYAATGHSFGVWTTSAAATLTGTLPATLLQPGNMTNVMTLTSNSVTIQGNVSVTGSVTCTTINGASGTGSGSGGGGTGSNASSLTVGTLNKSLLPPAFSVATDTQTMVITSSSNVGIGTSIATDLLTVNGSTRTSNLTINSATSNHVLVTDANNKCISSSVTVAELSSLAGIGSQTLTSLLSGKQNTISLSPPNQVVISAAAGLGVSPVTATELGYLAGVTSSVQAQLNTPAMANKIINGDMRIDQRNSLTVPVSSGYCVDRFKVTNNNIVNGGVTAGQIQLSATDQTSNGGLAYATVITAASSNIPTSNLILYCPFETWSGVTDMSKVLPLILNVKGTAQYVTGYNGQGSALYLANTIGTTTPTPPAANTVSWQYTVPANAALSVSMYIQFTAVPSNGKYSYPISFGSSTTAGLALVAAYNSTTSALLYASINGVGNTPTTTITINTWYHVAFVYTPGVSYSLYVNGTNVATYTGIPNPVPSTLPYSGYITLGDSAPTQGKDGTNNLLSMYPFGGYIDELRIYNRVLTGTEISLLAGTNLPSCAVFQQPIEGYDIADLAWGTSAASPVTVSCYIKNNTASAQAFTMSLNNGSQRYYMMNTPSIAANTWNYVSATVPGDVTGTWTTNSNLGVNLSICLGANVLQCSTSSNVWGSNVSQYLPYTTSNNQIYGASPTSFLGTPGNSLYITGLQLQKGNSATAYNMRTYSSELVAAKRFYERMYADNSFDFNWLQYVAGGIAIAPVQYTVQKRAVPTVTLPSSFWIQYGTGTINSNFVPTNPANLRTAGRYALSIIITQLGGVGSLEWRPNLGTFFAIDSEL